MLPAIRETVDDSSLEFSLAGFLPAPVAGELLWAGQKTLFFLIMHPARKL